MLKRLFNFNINEYNYHIYLLFDKLPVIFFFADSITH